MFDVFGKFLANFSTLASNNRPQLPALQVLKIYEDIFSKVFCKVLVNELFDTLSLMFVCNTGFIEALNMLLRDKQLYSQFSTVITELQQYFCIKVLFIIK